MARKLIFASLVSLALVPGPSASLELGGIRGQSALNDPFVGEIDLLEVTPEELETIKVELAPVEEFQKAGADRSSFLQTLQFKVKVSPNGRPIIQVTSPEPVREPFLDFLVEITWADGRVVEEYTVLLDPPVTTGRPPPPVESPAVSESALRTQPLPGSKPVPDEARPSTAPVALQPQERERLSVFPLRYGPIKPGDGLWRIARRIAPADATAAQTAMALYRNSQGAFIGGDINKLTVGEQLQIPTAAELYALDAGAAQRELSTAMAGGTVTAAPLTDVTAAAEPEDRLEIAPASQEEAAEEVVEPPRDEGEPAPELGALENELLLVREAGESTRQETQELRARIQDLETQLGDIQRLLELRNEQLAQLQGIAALDLEPSAADAAGVPPGQKVSSAPEGPAESPDKAEAGDADLAAAGADSDASPPRPGEEVEPAGDPAEQVAERTEPEQSVSIWNQGPWSAIPKSTLALGLAVPFLLLVLGWMILRRRRRSQEALMDDSLAADLAAVTAAGETDFTPPDSLATGEARALPHSSERSSHTVMSYTGFDDIEDETDEADVVSEADVYLAYGRYREAISLLDEGIAKAPGRLDLKLKLAEAHSGAGDIAGLRTLMDDIQHTAGDRISRDQWRRLEAMARDLSGAKRESGRARMTATGPLRRGPEPLSFPPGSAPAAPATGLEPEAELDFPTSDSSEGPLGPIEGRRSHSLELELEDLDLEAPPLDLSNKEGPSDWRLGESDLDFDFDDASLHEEDLGKRVAGKASLDNLETEPAAEDSASGEGISPQWQMDSEPWDPVATKIDLARAYLRMEDPEAARLILEEVVEEGNEEQRTEARDLLDRLD